MTIIGQYFAPKFSLSRRLNESERNGRDENGECGLKRQLMPGGLLGLGAPVVVVILTVIAPAIAIAVIADVVPVATSTKEMTMMVMRVGIGGMGEMRTEVRGKGKFATGRRGTENTRKVKKARKKINGLIPNAKVEKMTRMIGLEEGAGIDHGLGLGRGTRGAEGRGDMRGVLA